MLAMLNRKIKLWWFSKIEVMRDDHQNTKHKPQMIGNHVIYNQPK